MSAIFVGTGTTGKRIVRKIRDHLQVRVASAGNTPAAVELANQFKFFTVDTFSEEAREEHRAGYDFLMPTDPVEINERIKTLLTGDQDPFFRTWWPLDGGEPFLPGDFHEGAGQVRSKGKLAYRFHVIQTEGGPQLVERVAEAVEEIRDALGPAARQANQRIRIYLIGSEGGGTGGGMKLVIGQHLREKLPAYVVLIGVSLLASVTEKAPSRAERPFIWANTFAALVEGEVFQLPANRRHQNLRPLLEWPGIGGTIWGDEPTFLYWYLFGARNRSNLYLPEFDDYLRLVAECLVAEAFSPIRDDIAGPGAQFVQQFVQHPDHHGRPATYASAAVAHVSYPVARIERHLARRLGGRILRSVLPGSPAENAARASGAAAADQFLQANGLTWTDGRVLGAFLQAPLASEQPLESAPVLAVDDPEFRSAVKEQTMRIATDRKDDFDRWRAGEYDDRLLKRGDEAVRLVTGKHPDEPVVRGQPVELAGRLYEFVRAQLQAPDGQGSLRALGGAERAVKVLTAQHDAVMTDLHGPDWRRVQGRGGLELHRRRQREGLTTALEALGRGFTGLFHQNGRRAKAAFVDQWWNPWTDTECEYATARAAQRVLTQALDAATRLQGHVELLVGELGLLADELDDEATKDLGGHDQGAVLEVGVLDDGALVDAAFAALLANVHATNGDRVADHLVGTKRGVLDAFDRLVARPGETSTDERMALRTDLKALLIARGSELFAPEVRRRSIWDAFRIECALREELGLIDGEMQTALETTRRRSERLDRQGYEDIHRASILLGAFIAAKLTACRSRAKPFWSLNQGVVEAYGTPGVRRPFPTTVLALDQAAFDAFAQETGLGSLMTDLRAELGVDPAELPGKHVVTFYAREGGVPLFYLDARELQEMRDCARQVGRSRPLFTDRRFAGTVVTDLAPPEGRQMAARYALAVADHFGLLAAQNGHLALALNLRGRRRFAGLIDATQALTADPALLASLADRIDARWDTVTESIRGSELRRIADGARARSLHESDPALREWWATTEVALRQRERQGRVRVGR